MEFKDILKSERIAHGYTQEELGRLVGLKKSAIHKYENGLVVNPGRSLIFKFAQALNISPAYLLGIEDKEKETVVYTDEELQLLADFRKLNREGQSAALGVIHAYTLMETYIKKEESAAGCF